MSKITYKIFSGGERYPMLVDEDGIPDFWVTLFVTAKLRTSLTPTAIENTIRSILHLRLWEKMENRDLLTEFENGKVLSNEDINSIRDFCLLNKLSVIRYMKIKQSPNVLKLSWTNPSAKRGFKNVSKRHMAVRLTHIANYLGFVFADLVRQKENCSELNQKIDKMKRLIKAQGHKVVRKKGGANNFDLKAPSPEIFETFMNVTNEAHPDNPFKNPTVRTRNYLMFEVMDQTGFRSGEVLSLKIGDIDFDKNTLRVNRNHDDPMDSRARQPVPKTLEREVVITKELSERLRHYIFYIRREVPKAINQPFIFVVHKKGEYSGRPISDTSFRNRILAPVIQTNPVLFEDINRHAFRHNRNYRLSKIINANNEIVRTDPERAKRENLNHISEKKEIQIRNYIYGWSSDETAKTYTKRFVKEQAESLMRSDMEEQTKQLNKGKS